MKHKAHSTFGRCQIIFFLVWELQYGGADAILAGSTVESMATPPGRPSADFAVALGTLFVSQQSKGSCSSGGGDPPFLHYTGAAFAGPFTTNRTCSSYTKHFVARREGKLRAS